jgi:ADP-ribose pyrophosphatase
VGQFRRIGERVVHQGYIWRVVTAEFESPEGERFHRDIVRSPGAVGAVPVLDSSDDPVVVLVDQYRASYETTILEIPAGMRDVPGEAPEATAARELVEEVGLHPGRLVPLGSFQPSAGMTDSVTHLFAAYDLVEVAADTQGPEERHMTVLRLQLSEAMRMVVDGRIQDGKTVIALLRLERLLRAGS